MINVDVDGDGDGEGSEEQRSFAERSVAARESARGRSVVRTLRGSTTDIQ